MSASPTLDFLEGIAGVLVTASLGTYNPAISLANVDTAIALNDMPDAPDKAIVLTAYLPGGDDTHLVESRIALQVKTRGTTDPRTEMLIRDGCYAQLQGLRQRQFGSVFLIAMANISSVPLGRDSNGRWTFSSNFYADVDLPVTALRS